MVATQHTVSFSGNASTRLLPRFNRICVARHSIAIGSLWYARPMNTHLTKRKPKKKRPVLLSAAQAVKMVDDMTALLYEEVRAALRIEAVLEVGNDIVAASPNKNFEGAEAYNAIYNALIVTLASLAAKFFDKPSARFHLNESDKATIPLLVRLLRQRRVRRALVSRARDVDDHYLVYLADMFVNDCNKALDRADEAFRVFQRSTANRNATRRIKGLRDKKLAHLLMKPPAERPPMFVELFHLIHTARDVVDAAFLAVRNIDPNFDELSRIYRNDAETFWKPALAAMASGPDRQVHSVG